MTSNFSCNGSYYCFERPCRFLLWQIHYTSSVKLYALCKFHMKDLMDSPLIEESTEITEDEAIVFKIQNS